MSVTLNCPFMFTFQLPSKPSITHGICYRCYRVWRDISQTSNFLKHVKKTNCSPPAPPPPAPEVKCTTCQKTFTRKANLEQHVCPLLPPAERPLDQVVYKTVADNSYLQSKITGMKELEVYQLCFEEKKAIPGYFPLITPPLAHRKNPRFQGLGNTQVTDFLLKALKQKVLAKGANSLILHATVSIVNGVTGEEEGFLSRELTKPTSCLLKVTDLPDGFYEVSLVSPPTVKERPEIPRTESLVDMEFYSKFTSAAGQPYEPHQWPENLTEGRLLFSTPHMMSPKTLWDSTGLSVHDFWSLTEFLKESRILKGQRYSKLSLPAMVVLHRLKVRHDVKTSILKILFDPIDEKTIINYFWRINIALFDKGMSIPKKWSDPTLDDDSVNDIYKWCVEETSPFHKRILSRFKDPSGKNRKRELPISS